MNCKIRKKYKSNVPSIKEKSSIIFAEKWKEMSAKHECLHIESAKEKKVKKKSKT